MIIIIVLVLLLCPCNGVIYRNPKSDPHPRIPAARLFFVFLCFAVFYFTWGNPEVGGGDNFLDSCI